MEKKRNVRKGFIFHSKSSEISTDIETFSKEECEQDYVFLMNLVIIEMGKEERKILILQICLCF